MIIDDFVMLGRTVPEPNRKHEVGVCSAGVSPSLGSLIRVCPLAMTDKIPRWSTVAIDLAHDERRDNRVETRQLGSGGWEAGREYPRVGRAALLAPYRVSGIAEANDRIIDPKPGGNRRMSLAVVRPESCELRIEHNPGELAPHYELFGAAPPRARGRNREDRARFPFTVRADFRDEGGRHRLQIRDWGLFELLRKRHDELDDMTDDQRVSYVAQALHLKETSLFLVGNFDNYRKSWLVISVLNGCLPKVEFGAHVGQLELPLGI